MKDFIPKGTGNSRWMKSSIPTGTTWEEALAMLRAGTFPFDLNGINSAGVAQMGDALNVANLLPNEVGALYGLGATAVLRDVLKKLGSAVMFKRKSNPVTTTLSATPIGTPFYIDGMRFLKYQSNYNGQGTYLWILDQKDTCKWADSYVPYAGSFLDTYLTGTLFKKLPESVQNSAVNASIKVYSGSDIEDSSVVTINRKIFAASNGELYSGDDGPALSPRARGCTGEVANRWTRTPGYRGGPQYVRQANNPSTDLTATSADPTTEFVPFACIILPDDFEYEIATDDEYQFEDPLGNALGTGCFVDYGSYVGTGTYGANNPTKIPLRGKMSFLMIRCAKSGAPSNVLGSIGIAINSSEFIGFYRIASTPAFDDIPIKVTDEGVEITASAVHTQFNVSGCKYEYFGISK